MMKLLKRLGGILILGLLTSCLRTENVRIEKHIDGKATGIIIGCKISDWHSECGPTFEQCDDGRDHGCGSPDSDLWFEVK